MTRHPLRQRSTTTVSGPTRRRIAGLVATATLVAALVAAAPNIPADAGTSDGPTVGVAHHPADVFVLSADAVSGVRWD